MKVSAADLADRFSILDLKADRFPPNLAVHVMAEHAAYRDAVLEEGIPIEFCTALKNINGQIWDAEFAVRMGALSNPSSDSDFTEIGRRAIIIRDLNRQRIAIKNEITNKMGGFMEVKWQHQSQR